MRPLNDSQRPLKLLLREAVAAARQQDDGRARALLTLAVERDPSGRSHLMLVRFCWRRGLWPEARHAASALHELAQRRGCRKLQSVSANALAVVAREQGDTLHAAGWQQRSHGLDDAGQELGCDLTNRGNDALLAGDLELARVLFRSALDWEKSHGSVANQADDWGSLGLVALLQNRLNQADRCFRRALRLHRQGRNTLGMAQDCLHLGLIGSARFRWTRADHSLPSRCAWPVARTTRRC